MKDLTSLLMKIALVILLLICVILTIDKTRVSSRLNGVASKIAEKTKIIRDHEEMYRIQTDALQKVIMEQNQKFHFTLPDDLDRNNTPSAIPQPNVPGSKEEQLAAELAQSDSAKSSVAFSVQAVNLFRERFGDADQFEIDPASGLVRSRFASMLEEAVRRIGGLDAQTKLVWNLEDYTLKAEIHVRQKPSSAKKTIPDKTISFHFTPQKDDGPFLIQSQPLTTVFPFCRTEELPEQEIVLLDHKPVPVGGYYVHFFQIPGAGAWYLDYECDPKEINEKTNLRAIPLSGAEIRTSATDGLHTFMITPHQNDSMLIVIADQTFFPKKVTLAKGKRSFLPKAENPAKQ